MDRFHELQVFRRTVEVGNVTHAAELLHVSQPAVSRTLANLESRLGVELLRRSKRGVSVTEAGQDFYQQAVDILDRLDEVETGVAAQRGALSGSIRLATTTMLFTDILASIIAGFTAQNPDVKVESLLGMQSLDLSAANIDLAIRGGRPGGQDLVVRKLGIVEIALYASPAYLARHGMPETPDDLAQHSLIGSALDGGRGYWQLESETEGGVGMSLPVTVHHRADELLGTMALSQAGLGITLAPKYGAATRGLQRVLPNWRAAGPSIFLVWPSVRHMPARVRALADTFIAELPARLRGIRPAAVSS
ncbi:LysR family transcriptional regulator [Rhodovarius crocodyli]|uniref:LysR family transcriptional regulator n=1 Tax=Rhodovarius crocodyli TaxID=1979269 RepID=A0A437MMZ4_9PROT|nr:LysR family transcriptional regulator [Rhodovarius crocodyli]RVT99007.1 LysR family transcriptional regulator [Rhodovarius crocodyli]